MGANRRVFGVMAIQMLVVGLCQGFTVVVFAPKPLTAVGVWSVVSTAVLLVGSMVLVIFMPPKRRLSYDEHVEMLARVSHDTWMMQLHRDKKVPMAEIPTAITEHDRERARATLNAQADASQGSVLEFEDRSGKRPA